jgi:hypothetical protein
VNFASSTKDKEEVSAEKESKSGNEGPKLTAEEAKAKRRIFISLLLSLGIL